MATTFYTATTLDGFIADDHDSLDWLFEQHIEDDGPGNYPDFIAGDLSTSFIEERPQLLSSHQSKDRGTKILNWLAEVTVNQPNGARPAHRGGLAAGGPGRPAGRAGRPP